jgi:4-amino-4-deoxy-L-arabinose transferase-like glycosyltransferase
MNHPERIASERVLGMSPATLAVSIILLTTTVRFLFVATGQLGLSPDEAQYWDWSRTLQLSYYSKGPLVAYIIRFWTTLFGDTELGVRFGAVFNTMLTQVILYLGVARVLGRPRLGAWALVFANTTPLFMAAGVLMTTDNPLLLCWSAALFLSLRLAGNTSRPYDHYLLGLALALGILAKYMMLALIPMLIAYGWFRARQGKLPEGFWKKLTTAVLIGLIGGFLPIFLWNYQNGWVGFRHVFTLGGISGSKGQTFFRFDQVPEYLGAQVLILTPWWFLFVVIGAVRTLKGIWTPESSPGFDRNQSLLLSLTFWPLWLFMLLWSMHTTIYANWPAMSYLSGMIMGAAVWMRFFEADSRGRKALLALSLAVVAVVHLSPFLPLPERMNPMLRLSGWDDLGQTVDRMRQTEFDDPSRVFLLSDYYGITSGLSFYVPGQDRAYNVNVGRRMTQYDLWPGPQERKGWDAIFVRKEGRDLSQKVSRMFRRVEPGIEVQTWHKGRKGLRFTVFLCYGYDGSWPAPERESF